VRAALAVLLVLMGSWPAVGVAGGIALPKGEKLAQLEWTEKGLLLLTLADNGWALRLGNPVSGELSVIQTPRTFAALPQEAQVQLSPAGNAVAALVESRSHASPGRLWLYRLEGSSLNEVNLRKLERSFFPAGFAWGHDGEALFLRASRYLGSENPSSVVVIDLASGEVESAVLKADLDLISDLTYSPGRQALVVKAAGIRGEYPAEELIALVKPGSAEITVLHTAADDLSLQALPDGSVLVGSAQRTGERWVLLPGEDRLRRSEPRLPVSRWTASSDGKWLGGVVDGNAVGKEAGKSYGVLQSKASGRTVLTKAPCTELRFAPDSSSFAVVNSERNAVSVVEIPTGPTE
jgi:hypothetical protein